MIAVLRGQEAFTKGQADRAIACCEEALALLPEGWAYGRGGALLYWAMSMRACGRDAAAQRWLTDEYESLSWKTDPLSVSFTLGVSTPLKPAAWSRARQMGGSFLNRRCPTGC